MRRSILVVSACVAFAAVAGLVACGSPTVPDDGLGGGPLIETKKEAGAGSRNARDSATGGKPSPTPTSTPQGDAAAAPGAVIGTGACASAGNQDTCYMCCATANPKALPVLDNAYGSCACETPGTCQTDCAASFCSATGPDPTPGDTCDTCLTAADTTCRAQVETACNASADCKPLVQCEDDAKCATRAK